MKKYVTVYPFQLIDKLKEGKEVFCIDRGKHEVLQVSALPTKSFIHMLVESAKEKNYDRCEFYYIEEVKEGAKDAKTV